MSTKPIRKSTGQIKYDMLKSSSWVYLDNWFFKN